jgi:hypothetical protein
MTIIGSIKQIKSQIENHRTITKIHLSWDAARAIQLEFVEKHGSDYDPVSSNGSSTLLGCEMVIHVEQVEAFLLEDANGQKIRA